MTYLMSKVLRVTNSTIQYLDDENSEQEINLYECNANWVEHFNSHDYITWDGNPAPKITSEDSNGVGERDWFADKPYIELFSHPKIRFEIRPKKKLFDFFNRNWKDRYYNEFRKLCDDLQKAGWSTFDLG